MEQMYIPVLSSITTITFTTPDGRELTTTSDLLEFLREQRKNNSDSEPEPAPDSESEPDSDSDYECELESTDFELEYSDDLLKYWTCSSCDKLEFNDGNTLCSWGCKCCLITGESDYNWISKHLPMIECKAGITYKRFVQLMDEEEMVSNDQMASREECPYVYYLYSLFKGMYYDGFKQEDNQT